jgi:hypothetical protein
MSQNYHCHHGKSWPADAAPDCEQCHMLRLNYIMAALQGLCANSAFTGGEHVNSLARAAVLYADRTLDAAGARR